MTGQLSLFGAPAEPTDARPVYATPQPCGCCPAHGLIYSRMYDGDRAIDLCAACTADIVRIRRGAGLWVHDSYGWVV